MDISLHSFILVIGLIVIGFITWDGIKKVRAARANRLDQSFLQNDQLDVLANEELPKFDDLEIKEDVLQGGLKEQSDSVSFADALNEREVPPPIIGDIEPNTADDDGFEHFGASKDEPEFDTAIENKSDSAEQGLAEEPVNPLFDISLEDPVEVTVPVAKQETIAEEPKSTTSKPQPKPQRKSKEELAAQLAEVKAQANAKVEIPHPVTTEEVEVDEKEPVPVLMEPVELGQKVEPNPPKQHELILPERIQRTLIDEPIYAEEAPLEKTIKRIKPDSDGSDLLTDYIDEVQAPSVGEKLSERQAAEEIFVINILKQGGNGLSGKALNHVFKVCDMRHGEMNIFHRFEKANAQGKIQFSVVNAIEPGSFDLDAIDELVTPGISLFMSLPGPEKPMEAFDAMAEVALVFARNFDATLHDDTHSDLTPQTLEHYRNRIREFTRKHLSHKK